MGESMQMDFSKDSMMAIKTHTDLMKLHYKALGCHCEVMGMMSENALSASLGQPPLFSNSQFLLVMRKWGMVDEHGNPII